MHPVGLLSVVFHPVGLFSDVTKRRNVITSKRIVDDKVKSTKRCFVEKIRKEKNVSVINITRARTNSSKVNHLKIPSAE